MKNSHQLAAEAVAKIEPKLAKAIASYQDCSNAETRLGLDLLIARQTQLTEIIEAAIKESRIDEPTAEGKLVVFFIVEDDAGMGSLLHCRATAHQWLDAFLDNLDVGEKSRVDFKREHMTKDEIEALPEI